jgi:hypothetical protein
MLSAGFPKPDTSPAAVLFDEDDPRSFERGADGGKGFKTATISSSFNVCDRVPMDACLFGKVSDCPI